MTDQTEQAAAAPKDFLGVRNSGQPLRFDNVEPLIGFSAERAGSGQPAGYFVRLALTSDLPLFHRLVEGMDSVVRRWAEGGGVSVNLQRASTVVLVFRPGNCAELWVDTAAVSLQCTVKRAIAARSAVFESDVADVTGMGFPCIPLGGDDKVLCLFREGWSFGLAFDFNPEGQLDVERFTRSLGTLHRTLRYRYLYEAVNNQTIFGRLVAAGWFPFAEIITSEFRDLARHVEAGFDLSEMEAKIIAAFDTERLGHLLERWSAKPHFAEKAALLKEAIDGFTSGKPGSVIKIILTEIEGVLNAAHRAARGGQGAKLKDLLAFAQASGEGRAGGPDTLLFPAAFGRYLAAHTFAHFDPVAQTGTAGSRHAVGHGAAAQNTYTMTRALQAVLTLDQLAFYT